MSGLEYFLLLVGFIFIAASLFLIDRKKDVKDKVLLDVNSVFTEEDMKKVIKEINEKIEDIATSHVLDADDKLSNITNEKIIAVCEYTDQLFEKLENNHKEVIFLYNMLQEKEEEMKSTLNRMEVVRKENQVFMDKILELRSQKIKASSDNRSIEDGELRNKRVFTEVRKNNKPDEKAAVRPANSNIINTEPDMEPSVQKEDSRDYNELENKNEKILRLFKENKSLLEISKILGIGQGEVKLVIDLYGKGGI